MNTKCCVWRIGGTVLFLILIMTLVLPGAFGQVARKKPRVGAAGMAPDDYTRPQLLNADTSPTLRYPVASFSGWSVKSTSYGWFDVTRQGIRYSVPAGRQDQRRVRHGHWGDHRA